MRDRMGDLKSGGGAASSETPTPQLEDTSKRNAATNASPRQPSNKVKPQKEPKTTSASTAVSIDDVKAMASENGEDSEEMKQFFSDIETIREDIDTVKKIITLIQTAHENALNVISEAQSAETTQELERHMEKANKLSGVIRNKLKAMEAANKKAAKQPGRTGDVRIRITQHGAIAKKFLDVMMEYKDIQKKYQDKYKQRMQRQFLIVKPTANEEEIEKMMSGESGPVFAQSIMHSGQKAEAKRALQEIQDRHADVQRIEKSILV